MLKLTVTLEGLAEPVTAVTEIPEKDLEMDGLAFSHLYFYPLAHAICGRGLELKERNVNQQQPERGEYVPLKSHDRGIDKDGQQYEPQPVVVSPLQYDKLSPYIQQLIKNQRQHGRK